MRLGGGLAGFARRDSVRDAAMLTIGAVLAMIFGGRDTRLSASDTAMIAARVVLLSSCIGAISATVFWSVATGDLRKPLSGDSGESRYSNAPDTA